MKIYSIKMALRGVSPMVWRRLRIPGNTSLAQLHEIIQIAFNWDGDHLHQFHVYGKDYGINYVGAVMFSDNAHEVHMDDFEFDVGDKCRYDYNFFIDNIVDIRIEKITLSTKYLPVFCLGGSGMPGAHKQDHIEPTLELLKKISRAGEEIAMSDILPLLDEIMAKRFFRAPINHRFQTELRKAI